ncbi:MAG: hypothetical protein IPJ46_22850 [Anaerolineales bacterium]|nr:hypothetical protein [Anaerolineales bacterium]
MTAGFVVVLSRYGMRVMRRKSHLELGSAMERHINMLVAHALQNGLMSNGTGLPDKSVISSRTSGQSVGEILAASAFRLPG